MSDAPPAIPGPCRLLIGAGITVLLLLVGFGGAAYCCVTGAAKLACAVGERFFSQLPALIASSVVHEPAEVSALVTEIAPGATIPDGYAGLGFAFDRSQVTILAPRDCFRGRHDEPKADMFAGLTIVISRQTEDAGDDESAAVLSQADQTGLTEDLEPETIRIGGQDMVFQKRRVRWQDEDSGERTARLHYLGSWPVQGQQVVTVLIMGPEATFDRKTMDSFLGSLEPPGK